MTSAPQPDGPPLNPGIPEPPEWISEDPEMVELFTNSMHRLVLEARGLPMHTVQEFLLERIVTGYVTLRFRERNPELNPSAAMVRAQQASTAAWLDLVKEWDRVLASGQEKLREQLLLEVEKAIVEGLQTVEDPDTRKSLMRFFKGKFVNLGI